MASNVQTAPWSSMSIPLIYNNTLKYTFVSLSRAKVSVSTYILEAEQRRQELPSVVNHVLVKIPQNWCKFSGGVMITSISNIGMRASCQ